MDFLASLESNSAGIVFLDPPFNLGKKYSDEDPELDRRPEAQYADWMSGVIRESVRVLAPGGALYLYHLPFWALRLGGLLLGQLEFRHWIAVSMKNGFARGNRLYPAHYGLLYFTKGAPEHFSRPKLALEKCRHCDKPVKDYGGYKDIIAEKGLNLSDVWGDLSPVRHRSRKTRRANQLPTTLTDRVVEISGSEGMLLVDPFVGSGSSVVSAAKRGLRFAACDLVLDNCRLVETRLDDLKGFRRQSRE